MTAPNLDSLGFLYNADGIRTSKTYMPSNQDWITHTYTLSGSTILTEEWTENDVDHTILYLYDASGAPLGMRYTNSTKAGTFENYLFVTNLQGDIIHIYDDAGTRLVTYNYDAWGNHTVIYENGGASTAARYNPFRYRGYYYDVETGLYYLNSRYYDPQVGRFISADSYVSTGQGLLGNNMFTYCGNNPIMGYDPDGYINRGDARKFASGLIKIATGTFAAGLYGATISVGLTIVEWEVIDWHYSRMDKKSDIFPEVIEDIDAFKEKNVDSNTYQFDVAANCHNFSAENYGDHYKLMSFDGHYEEIYSKRTGRKVIDPRDEGSYNHRNPVTDPFGHAVLDVVPWLLYGNSEQDSTCIIDRGWNLIGGPSLLIK